MTKRLVSINEKGRRIGESHPRARLTDREIELVFALRAEGWGYKRIAHKMEMSVRHVRDVLACRKRAQFAAGFKGIVEG